MSGPDIKVTAASYNVRALVGVLDSIEPPESVDFSDIYRELYPQIAAAHQNVTQVLQSDRVAQLDEATLSQVRPTFQ